MKNNFRSQNMSYMCYRHAFLRAVVCIGIRQSWPGGTRETSTIAE